MRKNPRPDAVDAKRFADETKKLAKKKGKSYEWKSARGTCGVRSGHCRGLDRHESLGCGGPQSGGIYEGSGPVNSGDCLRGSDRVLHAFPGQVRKGKEI